MPIRRSKNESLLGCTALQPWQPSTSGLAPSRMVWLDGVVISPVPDSGDSLGNHPERPRSATHRSRVASELKPLAIGPRAPKSQRP